MRLAARRAVVIGVGSAVGAACATALVDEGAEVLAVDPDRSVAAQFAGRYPAGVWHEQGALASSVDAQQIAAACAERWGAVDILVDCGSAMEVWPTADDTIDRLSEVLVVNILGPMIYTMAFEGLLKESRSASVVYLGSIDGIRGNPNVPAYSMSKGGLLALTHVMAARLGQFGIRVNCIAAAGIVQTGSGVGPVDRDVGDMELAMRLTPLGRMPRVEEVATVAVFFASDDSSYVTGAVLPVDGGRLSATPGTW